MTGMTGPISGQNNLSVAQQGLKLLQARDQSLGRSHASDAEQSSDRIADILSTNANRLSVQASAASMSELTDQLVSRISSRLESIGSEEFGDEIQTLDDSDAERNFARAITAQVNGNRVTLNAASHAQLQINGNDSTVNVAGTFRGQVNGDNLSLNIADDVDMQINGSNVSMNVAGSVMGQINGDNVTLTAREAPSLQINGDNATLNLQTLRRRPMFNGANLTLNAEVALDNVVMGSTAYVDPKTGNTLRLGNGSGDIKLTIGTAAGTVATGDGNDVLIVGSSVAVGGGRGDDTIKVGSAKRVSGGLGNDNIEVGAGVERVGFARGDGHDVVTADKGTTIEFGALSKDKVRISAEDGTYRISFEDSDDTIELRTQEGATSRLSFGYRQGSIELKDGAITYV